MPSLLLVILLELFEEFQAFESYYCILKSMFDF